MLELEINYIPFLLSPIVVLLRTQRDNEEKAAEIERLRQELEKARQSTVALTVEPTVTVPRNKLSPKNSPPMCRPHSCHLDIADLAPSGGPPLTGGGDGAGDSSSPHIPADTGT